jgi:hypothetical protein
MKLHAAYKCPSAFSARILPIRNQRISQEAIRKGLGIRMGRYPAEIAEGAEVYWEGEKGPTSVPFSTTALVN